MEGETQAVRPAIVVLFGVEHAYAAEESGEKGGVAEKVIPALERDIHVILIDRPREE